MARREDWPKCLVEYVEANANRAFVWGEFDCARFAAGWVREATGDDVLVGLDWHDERSARRLMRAGLPALVSERLGAPIPVALAQRGDVVLTTINGRDALGVCLGEVFAMPAMAGGVALVLMDRADAAWAVGR